MQRKYVLNVISKECEYVDSKKGSPDSHIVEDFPLSAGMEAIRYNLDKANEAWYNEKAPYPTAMEYIRKIAGICVQMGERYGMPYRRWSDAQIFISPGISTREFDHHGSLQSISMVHDKEKFGFDPTIKSDTNLK